MTTTAVEVDRAPADFHLLVSEPSGPDTIGIGVDPDLTIGELLDLLSIDLDLPVTDADGLALNWSLVDVTESRRLLPGEVVSQTVNENDQLQLVPEVAAGGRG